MVVIRGNSVVMLEVKPPSSLFRSTHGNWLTLALSCRLWSASEGIEIGDTLVDVVRCG